MQAGDMDAFSVIPGDRAADRHGAQLQGVGAGADRATADRRSARRSPPASARPPAASTTRLYPATINSLAEARFAGDVAESLVGADHVIRDLPPSMGAEDFSFMLQARPGAYLRLGQGGADDGMFLHNTRYDFNDDVLPLGAGPPRRARRTRAAALRPHSVRLVHDRSASRERRGSRHERQKAACRDACSASRSVPPAPRRPTPRPSASRTRATRCRWIRIRSTSRCSSRS